MCLDSGGKRLVEAHARARPDGPVASPAIPIARWSHSRGRSSKNRLVTIYFSIETTTHPIKETIDLGSGDTRGSIDVRSAGVTILGRYDFLFPY